MADAHAAAERKRRSCALTGDEDWLRAVAARADRARAQVDRAAAAALSIAEHAVGREALDVHARWVAVLAPALAERGEQASRSAQERLALAPVRAQPVELRRRQASLRAREPLVQGIATMGLLGPLGV